MNNLLVSRKEESFSQLYNEQDKYCCNVFFTMTHFANIRRTATMFFFCLPVPGSQNRGDGLDWRYRHDFHCTSIPQYTHIETAMCTSLLPISNYFFLFYLVRNRFGVACQILLCMNYNSPNVSMLSSNIYNLTSYAIAKWLAGESGDAPSLILINNVCLLIEKKTMFGPCWAYHHGLVLSLNYQLVRSLLLHDVVWDSLHP